MYVTASHQPSQLIIITKPKCWCILYCLMAVESEVSPETAVLVYTCTFMPIYSSIVAMIVWKIDTVVDGPVVVCIYTLQLDMFPLDSCDLQSKMYGYSSSQCNIATPLWELTCSMGSHSVTCHPAEVTFLPLPWPKLVLDLATPEGCKSELT